MMLILHRIEMLQTEEWTVLYFFAWPCAVNYFRSGSKRYLHLCPLAPTPTVVVHCAISYAIEVYSSEIYVTCVGQITVASVGML